MENKVFDIVLLVALPASGKSEVRNFMANIEPDRLQKEFHIGETLQLDDFPYVHMMRRIDNELEKMGEERPWIISHMRRLRRNLILSSDFTSHFIKRMNKKETA